MAKCVITVSQSNGFQEFKVSCSSVKEALKAADEYKAPLVDRIEVDFNEENWCCESQKHGTETAGVYRWSWSKWEREF